MFHQALTALYVILSSIYVDAAAANARRRILLGSSIADEVLNEHANGNPNPKFTLVGEVAGSNGKDQFSINVRELDPAVTNETTYSRYDEPPVPLGGIDFSILVADQTDPEDEGNFALITVDKKTGKVDGIVNNANGKSKKFTQDKGQKAIAYDEPYVKPREWECLVGPEHEVAARRSLSDSGDHNDHEHEGHKHGDQLFHRHDFESVFDELRDGLRGSKMRMGKRRKLQSGSYSFEVKVYIEIDTRLVQMQGSEANAINYVNVLFTGLNAIYQEEIDTRLTVSGIALTTRYDSTSLTGPDSALSIMRTAFSSLGFNYSPGMDIHHAILGYGKSGVSASLRNWGGIAYLGVICNSVSGFGVSGGIEGTFSSITSSTKWDLFVVAHEIGHNFNTGHTHDGGYNPRIDTCGCPYTNGACSGGCPASMPVGSATIMSYCNTCGYGMAPIAYTFGGKYVGTGSRSSILNYVNSSLSGTVSTEPRQIPPVMYTHVSSRGSCVAVPNTSPTSQPTAKPTSKPTAKPTSKPTANPTAKPTAKPTTKPSAKPTAKPTGPTTKPTAKPTLKPTSKPTLKPTLAPTTPIPTKAPTKQPTNAPTPLPTSNPTNAPTPVPTMSPSNAPTPLPTSNPTNAPTPAPTMSPTDAPTSIPTKNPTNSPTPEPTMSPTDAPTRLPTNDPTNSPTMQPTSCPVCGCGRRRC